MKVERDGDVHVLTMTSGENRFNLDHLAEIEEALDGVEGADGGPAVVLTGEGKFFSNGLDLEWMGGAAEGEAQESVERSMRLMARLLTFPTGVVAAINGHCFAAGAMLALSCDERVMRADRGFFCLPEVDIDMRFLEGMHRLITLRLAPATAHEAMLTGRRYGGGEALAAGIVGATASEDELVAAAVERARPYAGKNPEIVTGMKRDAYADVVEALHRPLEG
jgi:enoyl-CoA hydratase/carnithine racemase